jgi:fatty acid desaturase
MARIYVIKLTVYGSETMFWMPERLFVALWVTFSALLLLLGLTSLGLEFLSSWVAPCGAFPHEGFTQAEVAA